MEKIKEAVVTAVDKSVQQMGDKINGIDWFLPNAQNNS